MNRISEIDLGKRELSKQIKLAIWTDHANFIDANAAVTELEKLLELRAFDEAGETRFYRSYVGEDFFVREITDESKPEDGGWFDQEQFLDIDTKRTKDGTSNRFTTGGGSYHLPKPGATKLIVRYYYRFDDDGVAYVYDKRLVKFVK